MKEPKLLISQIVGKTKYACFKSKAIIIKCVMFHYDSSLLPGENPNPNKSHFCVI